MHGSKALRFGIRLFSASTVVSAVALLLSASSGSQRPSRLPPSLQRGLAGAATAFAAEEATGSQAGPLRMLTGAALRRVADLKQRGHVGRCALVRSGARRQLVAMKQPNGAARLALDRSFRGALTKQADYCGKGSCLPLQTVIHPAIPYVIRR